MHPGGAGVKRIGGRALGSGYVLVCMPALPPPPCEPRRLPAAARRTACLPRVPRCSRARAPPPPPPPAPRLALPPFPSPPQVLPRLGHMMAGWSPLESPGVPVAEFASWRPLLESEGAAQGSVLAGGRGQKPVLRTRLRVPSCALLTVAAGTSSATWHVALWHPVAPSNLGTVALLPIWRADATLTSVLPSLPRCSCLPSPFAHMPWTRCCPSFLPLLPGQAAARRSWRMAPTRTCGWWRSWCCRRCARRSSMCGTLGEQLTQRGCGRVEPAVPAASLHASGCRPPVFLPRLPPPSAHALARPELRRQSPTPSALQRRRTAGAVCRGLGAAAAVVGAAGGWVGVGEQRWGVVLLSFGGPTGGEGVQHIQPCDPHSTSSSRLPARPVSFVRCMMVD